MALKYYRLANFLSIDVALGACAGMYFFARLLEVNLKPVAFLLMTFSVWVIYTFDHLLDARGMPPEHASPRHQFHQRYFRPLAIALSLVMVLVVLLAFKHLPSAWIFGVSLALATLILASLLVTQHFKYPLAPWKEVSIAFFYVVGIMLLPMMKKEFLERNLIWVAFAFGYFLLAWYNLVLLSLLDCRSDLLSGQQSVVTRLGEKFAQGILKWAGVLGIVYFFCLLIFLPSYYRVFSLMLLLMYAWHVRYLLERQRLPTETIRRRLELSFTTPLLFVLLPQ